jgi:cytochrome P450
VATAPPGARGLPLIGETPAFLRNPYRFLEERQRRYGDVFSSRVLFRTVAFLTGPDGAEAFYDPENVTRTKAHPYPLRDLFGGDNMEMFDGERHLGLKTITLQAFDEAAIGSYLPDLEATIEAALAGYAAEGRFVATTELKRLAIRCIWGSVIGPIDPAETDAVARDYATVVAGITAVPVALPGTPYGRARRARDRLLRRIEAAVAARRAAPAADGLSRILAATGPGGVAITDREAVLEVHHIVIAGFIVYLLMVEVLRRLAEQPALRDRCATEVREHLGDGPLTMAWLGDLATCTDVVREAKRITPIVPLAFGRARRAFSCGAHTVPAGWTVYLALHLLNHDPRVFPDPDRFDADRFAPGRAEHERHPMAFIPQGAEPPTGHRCLGLDYSTTLVLAFLATLLRRFTWSLPSQDLSLDPRRVPPEPRDGLRVRIEPIG